MEIFYIESYLWRIIVCYSMNIFKVFFYIKRKISFCIKKQRKLITKIYIINMKDPPSNTLSTKIILDCSQITLSHCSFLGL